MLVIESFIKWWLMTFDVWPPPLLSIRISEWLFPKSGPALSFSCKMTQTHTHWNKLTLFGYFFGVSKKRDLSFFLFSQWHVKNLFLSLSFYQSPGWLARQVMCVCGYYSWWWSSLSARREVYRLHSLSIFFFLVLALLLLYEME